MATKNRKLVLSYSLTPGTKRALELTAQYLKCTKNQVLDYALYDFINEHIDDINVVQDILKDMGEPLNIVRW